MTTKDEALKLALEALELNCSSQTESPATKAMAAIRSALAEQPAQQEPQRWAVFCQGCRKEWSVSYPHPGKSICAECDAKVEAQQQEPVAWMFQHEETGRTMCVDAQQVEWGFEKGNPRLKKIAPLYTSPPASKPWVGLTSKEREELDAEAWHFGPEAQYGMRVSEMTEAKLREKNHG